MALEGSFRGARDTRAPLRARACCGVRTERTRPGLATSVGAELRRIQAKKSRTEMAEQCKRTGKSVTERFNRTSLYAEVDAATTQRAAHKKD